MNDRGMSDARALLSALAARPQLTSGVSEQSIVIIVRLTLLRLLRALTIDDHRRLGRLYEDGIRGEE